MHARQGRSLLLHARPLQEPLWTPRDRKCPPVGAGGAGPAAALPVPTRRRCAATGPSLCVARGAQALPGPGVRQRLRRRGARGEWVAGPAGGRCGVGVGVGSGPSRPSTPAREAAARGGADRAWAWAWRGWSGALAGPWAAAPTPDVARDPCPRLHDRTGSDPQGRFGPAARSRRLGRTCPTPREVPATV